MKKIFQAPENKNEAVIHLVFYSLAFVSAAYWWLPINKTLNVFFSQLNFAVAYLFAGPALLVASFVLSRYYVLAAKVFILDGKIKVGRFLCLYFFTYLTMASSFWFGAVEIESAFAQIKEEFLRQDFLSIFFLILLSYLFFNLIFKTWCLHNIDKKKCAEDMAGLFSGMGIFLWFFFIFFFYRGEQEKDFTAAYPNAVYNYKANDFIWYSFWSAIIVLSFLLTIKLDKRARAVFDANT
jgi:hypothetical protein